MCAFTLTLILRAALPSVAMVGEDEEDVVLYCPSYAFGKVYASKIGEVALAKSPAWLEAAENPPVSARRAMTLADAKRERLVHNTKRYKWRRESTAIEFVKGPDRPYPFWHIHYEAHDRAGETGIPSDLDLFVLMDGSVIEPVVTEDKEFQGQTGNSWHENEKMPRRADGAAICYQSYAFGRVYASMIKEGMLTKSPAWLEAADNPPVSARRAMWLADAKRGQLVHDTERYKWQRESTAIEAHKGLEQSYRHPYWHIHYEAHNRAGESGIPHHLDLFVLMDGSVIEPVVREEDRVIPVPKNKNADPRDRHRGRP